ncbi:hypothetical protein DNTS_031172, partial [Danionella cerebrum]
HFSKIIMPEGNITIIKNFVIVGFPGLPPHFHILLSTFLFFVYVFILFGNAVFLTLFVQFKSLRRPVYYFIVNLVVCDLLFSTTTLPKIISRYWIQDGSISFLGCFVQMFFVHYFGSVCSLILTAMALDRYAAICYPLQYHTIMTNRNVFILMFASWVIGFLGPLAMAIRAYPLPYCSENAIMHCFCDHFSITSLACTDRSPYSIPALVYAFLIHLGPFAVVIFSYCFIFVTVLRISGTQGKLKTFSTCSPQLIIIVLYFVPRLFNYLSTNVGIKISTDVRLLIVMLYSLLPPMINPLIYCLRTEEIKKILKRVSEETGSFTINMGLSSINETSPNTSSTIITEFILRDFPGLPSVYYGFVGAIFFIFYLILASGNMFIIIFVLMEKSLQKPSYIIFCNLAMADLALGTTTYPKVIAKHWMSDKVISFSGCFTQMYFVHFLGATNSFLMALMALDRFIAICNPLRYHSFIKNSTILIICACVWIANMLQLVGVTLLTLSMRFCGSNVIPHCYCDHVALSKLACGNVTTMKVTSTAIAMFVLWGPLSFILFSYVAIIFSLSKISHSEGRYKAFSTCTPQLLIICLYYLPRTFVYISNIAGFELSTDTRMVVSVVYNLFPGVINPFIYCLRTKEIKEAIKTDSPQNFLAQEQLFNIWRVMTFTNVTVFSEFFLLGFPELHPEFYGAVGTILLLIYLPCQEEISLSLDLLLQREVFRNLLCDLAFGTAILPKIIAKYLFNINTISFYGCFVQMFFFHYFASINSFILLIVAIDRLVAVCNPLRYCVLITNRRVFIAGGVIWTLLIPVMGVAVYHAFDEPYCASNVVAHLFCESNAIMKLSCGDVKQKRNFAVGWAMFFLLGPLICITLSFIGIFITVFKISDIQARYKAFSTCTPQLMIVFLHYIPRCVIYSFDMTVSLSPNIRIVLTVWCSLLPPIVNPMIYCFRTKEIKVALQRKIRQRKVYGNM